MFFVFQIGAREHYAIPRALHASGELAGLFTDFWMPPGQFFGRLPGARRLRDRWHADLGLAPVHAPNARMLAFELQQRLSGRRGWDAIVARNELFQRLAVQELAKVSDQGPRTKDQGRAAGAGPRTKDASQAQDQGLGTMHQAPSIPSHLTPLATSGTARRSSPTDLRSPTSDSCPLTPHSAASPSRSTPMGTSGTARRSIPTVFSYSYSALELFRYAKSRGWCTVLGQIDPGPEEQRIVAAERERYSHLASDWQPAPESYWENWRQEIGLADRIIVNSEWSRQCLLKEGVPEEKLEIVPLVYQNGRAGPPGPPTCRQRREEAIGVSPVRPFHLLFLGQIILRKGIGRLLDAMRLLKDEPVELILAGPSEIDPSAWADLPRVRWLGQVQRSEVGQVYQNADGFILPTLSDGYALTQLEALSYGLPVIASKHCGEAVTHGRNGWILEDLEPETIAAAIRSAMTESLPDVRPPEFSLDDLAAALIR
jgi:hypothetical protein